MLTTNGIKTPKQIAVSTSVGQCTPSTRRDSPIRLIHSTASGSATLPDFGQMRMAIKVKAVEKAAVLNVCPLGKLDPQYQVVLHSSGRARLTAIFNA